MSAKFHVEIREVQPLTLYGLSVRTDMAKASIDCPKIWEKDFCPRMPELSGKPMQECQGNSYGISVIVDLPKGVFDYWAAMPPADGVQLPEGMGVITIPGGRYAQCRIPSLAELGNAYTYLYMEWIGAQTAYSLNMQASCFELYGREYLENGSLDVFMPLLEM